MQTEEEYNQSNRPQGYYHFSHLTNKLYALYLFIHFTFIFLFEYLNIRELYYFNIIAVFSYGLALYLNFLHRYTLAFAVCTVEVVLHAFLCTIYIGDAGFADAVIFLPMLFFIHPANVRDKLFYCAMLALIYMLLSHYDQFELPRYDFPEFLMQILNILTNFLIIVICSYTAYYYHNAIHVKEVALKQENQKLDEQYKLVERLSITDKLTQLYNRIKIEETFQSEIERSRRTGDVFSIILIDLDHFKSVNDNYGHHIGDLVLQQVARFLQDNSRKTDVVGRWGGEEFIIICPNTKLEGAAKLAEKIRKSVEQADIDKVGKVTASMGVAAHFQEDTTETMLIRVDEALYKAKEKGRNRVIVSD